jgi:DNA-binding GntR family transcriptional regulator
MADIDPKIGRIGALEHRALVGAVRGRNLSAAGTITAEHLPRTARRVAP